MPVKQINHIPPREATDTHRAMWSSIENFSWSDAVSAATSYASDLASTVERSVGAAIATTSGELSLLTQELEQQTQHDGERGATDGAAHRPVARLVIRRLV